MEVVCDKDKKLIELYEQMRGTALSDMSTRARTRGLGVLAQRGVASWMEAVHDFAPLSKHEVPTPSHSEPATWIRANTVQMDLTNILVEMALKNVREQIQI